MGLMFDTMDELNCAIRRTSSYAEFVASVQVCVAGCAVCRRRLEEGEKALCVDCWLQLKEGRRTPTKPPRAVAAA